MGAIRRKSNVTSHSVRRRVRSIGGNIDGEEVTCDHKSLHLVLETGGEARGRENILREGNPLDLEQGCWSTNQPTACFPSHDSHDAQNSDRGQEVKQYKVRDRGKSLLRSLRLLLQKGNTNKITPHRGH